LEECRAYRFPASSSLRCASYFCVICVRSSEYFCFTCDIRLLPVGEGREIRLFLPVEILDRLRLALLDQGLLLLLERLDLGVELIPQRLDLGLQRVELRVVLVAQRLQLIVDALDLRIRRDGLRPGRNIRGRGRSRLADRDRARRRVARGHGARG
jgi:hypothetical protein